MRGASKAKTRVELRRCKAGEWRRSVDRFLRYHRMPRPSGRLGYSAFRNMRIDWDHPERYIVRGHK